MHEIDAFAVFAPERVGDPAYGKRCERDGRATAVGVRDIQISNVRAIPSEHDALVVRRPDWIGGVLDFDELLDGEARSNGRPASCGLRVQMTRARKHRGKSNTRSPCTPFHAHSASPSFQVR